MKRFLPPAILTIGASLLVLLLSSLLSPIEDQITTMKYRMRGEQKADSNIVIVFIDNDAIKELGWPVRRNYHALMIRALTDLKAKAIGVDVLFENPSLEYPEYDQLLRHVVAGAHNVVVSAYFSKLVLSGWKLARVDESAKPSTLPEHESPLIQQLNETFDYPLVSDVYRLGDELHVPMPGLLRDAGGVGHVNIEEDKSISLFVASEHLILPSFGTEVLRVYSDAKRDNLRFDHETLALRRDGKLHEIRTEEGKVLLNYAGRISSFTVFPFLEVLKSYDALRSGRTPAIAVQNLKDKIVLIGVIAEGRTETFATPLDPRFPALGLHAVFLDNALRSGFLRIAPEWLVIVLCFLVAAACSASSQLLKSLARIVVPAGVLAAVVGISFGLFFASAYILPVVPLIAVGLVASTASIFYKHRFLHKQLQTVHSEKEKIASELRDREAKVAVLEQELVSLGSKDAAHKTADLLEEIRRYKAEIHTLSAQKDDMEEAAVAGSDAIAEMKNFEGIVYEAGGAMQPVINFISKIAQSDATVLILGESGTGKEMIARAIHKGSNRANQAFVAVNCGALSESLLESELFGHEKGAFTGAVKDKPGRFELANGGTIFLDEIGEVNEAFQLKLLRVLQEGEFERVGGTKTLKVNVRVIAATNKDLKELVNGKRFREDVYYRLNVLAVELPPLKERQGDIPLLIEFFLQKEGGGMKVSKNVLDTLQNYAWRGNIRELESVITRAVLFAKSEKRTMITMKDLSEELSAASRNAVAIEDQILESMREKGFSRSAISETADELGGLNRGTVAEYLRGQCLKAFVEHTYDLDTTVRYISLLNDKAVNDRVSRKLQEYLANIADVVDVSKSWDAITPTLKPKMKNLPQKYHSFLEQVAEAYYRGVWKSME